jgi:hypothetical protein
LAALPELSRGVSFVAEFVPIVEARAFSEVAARLQRLFDAVVPRGSMSIAVHVGSIEQEEGIFPKWLAFVAEFNSDTSPFEVPKALEEETRDFAATPKIFFHAETPANQCTWAVPYTRHVDQKSPAVTCVTDIRYHDVVAVNFNETVFNRHSQRPVPPHQRRPRRPALRP